MSFSHGPSGAAEQRSSDLGGACVRALARQETPDNIYKDGVSETKSDSPGEGEAPEVNSPL